MGFVIVDAAIRAVISGRREDRDAEGGGFLKSLTHSVDRSLRPRETIGLKFRPAPTDRNDRRLVDSVMNSLRHNIDPALFAPGSEVDGNFRAWRGGSGNVDIEQTFNRRIVVPGIVGAAIDTDCGDGGGW